MAMKELRFDDQVALVTGAGGGMGRSYAIELARRGARVVVNDYGGTTGGVSGNSDRAEAVVREIAEFGGNAVANGAAVGTDEAARAMVDQAVDAFGRLDILINNAGIVVLGGFDGVPFDSVETVYQTNLIGPHALISAAWPVMKRQGYGRILNVSSNSTLGSGGCASYSASKAGMIGLAMDAARDGASLGINVNAVMPLAYSRMFDDIPEPAFIAWMKTNFTVDDVALAMLPLLSRECSVTGRIFSTGGGRIARIALVEGEGVFLPDLTPENALAQLATVDAMDQPVTLNAHGDELALYTRQFPFDGPGGPGVDPSKITNS
jgi:NAD(P)-dependent dehydrogenase (short-subunit alcohol dehydrogenase family)